jgi:hypothetical protein
LPAGEALDGLATLLGREQRAADCGELRWDALGVEACGTGTTVIRSAPVP